MLRNQIKKLILTTNCLNNNRLNINNLTNTKILKTVSSLIKKLLNLIKENKKTLKIQLNLRIQLTQTYISSTKILTQMKNLKMNFFNNNILSFVNHLTNGKRKKKTKKINFLKRRLYKYYLNRLSSNNYRKIKFKENFQRMKEL